MPRAEQYQAAAGVEATMARPPKTERPPTNANTMRVAFMLPSQELRDATRLARSAKSDAMIAVSPHAVAVRQTVTDAARELAASNAAQGFHASARGAAFGPSDGNDRHERLTNGSRDAAISLVLARAAQVPSRRWTNASTPSATREQRTRSAAMIADTRAYACCRSSLTTT